jgi:hypothetical protein
MMSASFINLSLLGIPGGVKMEEQPIIPKDKGYRLMVSEFQSIELGFGYNLTSEQLATIKFLLAINKVPLFGNRVCSKSEQ